MKFEIPTLIYQEREAVKLHANEIAAFGKKAFIVTGSHSSKENGALQDVTEVLEKTNTEYVIFDKITQNPSVEEVETAAQEGKENKVDFVIGIGGGSPMDAAKAIALLIQNPDKKGEVLYQNIELEALPVIEVPTTCGTGSEATPVAILTRNDIQTKQSCSHRIFPKMALVDGKYIKNAPLKIITDTAIDALGHMLESYFNEKATDYSRMLAQYAMEVWAAGTDILFGMDVSDGDYDKLMFASTLAGMAIAHTGTSIPHGLSYSLTYHNNIPHGHAVGIFLPSYMTLMQEKFEIQVTMALRALGFGSLEQFHGFMHEMYEPIEISDEQAETMVTEIFNNKKKMSTVPVPIDKEQLYSMINEVRKK